GAPRFVFNDFPLGNSAGRPYDKESQAIVLNAALHLLENAAGPGSVVQTPLKWIGRKDWKSFYSNPDLLSAEEIAERRAKFDEGKAVARALRESSTDG
ncbi:MAG: glycine reductase, partial [Paracoccaceae bacterium]